MNNTKTWYWHQSVDKINQEELSEIGKEVEKLRDSLQPKSDVSDKISILYDRYTIIFECSEIVDKNDNCILNANRSYLERANDGKTVKNESGVEVRTPGDSFTPKLQDLGEVMDTLYQNLYSSFHAAFFYAERVSKVRGMFGYDYSNLCDNIITLEGRINAARTENAANSLRKQLAKSIAEVESFKYLVEMPNNRKGKVINGKAVDDKRLMATFNQLKDVYEALENNAYFDIEYVRPLTELDYAEKFNERFIQMNTIIESTPTPVKVKENYLLIPIGVPVVKSNEEKLVTRNLPLSKAVESTNVAHMYITVRDHRTGNMVRKMKCEETRPASINRCKSMPSDFIIVDGEVKTPKAPIVITVNNGYEADLQDKFILSRMSKKEKRVSAKMQKRINAVPHPLY